MYNLVPFLIGVFVYRTFHRLSLASVSDEAPEHLHQWGGMTHDFGAINDSHELNGCQVVLVFSWV